MSEFFKQAPVQNSFHKKLLDSIFHKQSLVGSFPVGYPLVSLYALPAMTARGMVVSVCPDPVAIQRNVALLKRSGLEFPAVAALDGTQMPHEERETLEHVNHHRVRLLLTTPARFASVRFLPMLARHDVALLVVESAHHLLPGFSGSYQYHKLQEGLRTVEKHIPMMVLAQPLPPSRWKELTERLTLLDYTVVHTDPAPERTSVRVGMLFTEHQKWRRLLREIGGASHRSDSGPVIVHTSDKKTRDKLARRLSRHGFPLVLPYGPPMDFQERWEVERVFQRQVNAIVVTCGGDMAHLGPSRSRPLKIIYWDTPTGLEEVFGQLFRVSDVGSESRESLVDGLILHTKEDFERALHRVAPDDTGMDPQQRGERMALRNLRRWILSRTCRWQSLVSFWQGSSEVEAPPCGRCDRCAAPSYGGVFASFLKHWLY